MVIPKQLRHAAALQPGQELEIIERDGFLAAEIDAEVDPTSDRTLSSDDVRDLLERTSR